MKGKEKAINAIWFHGGKNHVYNTWSSIHWYNPIPQPDQEELKHFSVLPAGGDRRRELGQVPQGAERVGGRRGACWHRWRHSAETARQEPFLRFRVPHLRQSCGKFGDTARDDLLGGLKGRDGQVVPLGFWGRFVECGNVFVTVHHLALVLG